MSPLARLWSGRHVYRRSFVHVMRRDTEGSVMQKSTYLLLCLSCRLYAHLGALAATGNALTLEKALRQKMWPGSQEECRQMPNIGKLLASRLAANELGRLRALQKADPRHIEAAAQRNYPFGE
jgi:hypothetical protein